MVQIPRLREWREARALTQVELAELANVSSRSVAGYEAGAGARPPTVRKLAKVLGIEVADLREDPDSPKAEAPHSQQLTLNELLAEERRAEATIWESEHLKSYVRDNLEQWWRVARGDDPHLDADHAYTIEAFRHIAGLTNWFNKVLRTIYAELPPEAAVAEHREIVRLIDDMQEVGDELMAIADAAEGITEAMAEAELQALIDQTAAEYGEQATGSPVADLAERRRQREEGRLEIQRQAAEAKRQATVE
jgi:transcriptional regulator with XRE-family HTH domain